MGAPKANIENRLSANLAIKGVAENQKSESTGSYTRVGRHLLRGFPPFSLLLCLAAYRPKFFFTCVQMNGMRKSGPLSIPKESAAPISSPSLVPQRSGPTSLQRIMTLARRESDLHPEFFALRLFGTTQQSDFKSRKRTYVGLSTWCV
jgi:hypothetical protein